MLTLDSKHALAATLMCSCVSTQPLQDDIGSLFGTTLLYHPAMVWIALFCIIWVNTKCQLLMTPQRNGAWQGNASHSMASKHGNEDLTDCKFEVTDSRCGVQLVPVMCCITLTYNMVAHVERLAAAFSREGTMNWDHAGRLNIACVMPCFCSC